MVSFKAYNCYLYILNSNSNSRPPFIFLSLDGFNKNSRRTIEKKKESMLQDLAFSIDCFLSLTRATNHTRVTSTKDPDQGIKNWP